MNPGKQFEADFIKSMPDNAWAYRLRDSAGTWQGGENTRFTPSNICDFIVFSENTLYLLELKSHKGKSLPLSCIRQNNLKQMVKAQEHENIYSMLIVNFRDVEETYAIHVHMIEAYCRVFPEKKSIPLQYFRDGIEIPQTKLKTHYRYGVESLLG